MLIGPNNAGKSNVLDAIIAWSANTYADKRNISDTFMPAKMRNPLVELFTLVDDKRNLIKPKIEIDLFSNKTFPVNKEVNSLVDYFCHLMQTIKVMYLIERIVLR